MVTGTSAPQSAIVSVLDTEDRVGQLGSPIKDVEWAEGVGLRRKTEPDPTTWPAPPSSSITMKPLLLTLSLSAVMDIVTVYVSSVASEVPLSSQVAETRDAAIAQPSEQVSAFVRDGYS